LHLGTDLIVGYPGESDEIFLEQCRRIESIPFANLHIFPFSPRQGTPAALEPDRVPSNIVAERCRHLKSIGDRLARTFATSQIGKALPVLVEKKYGSDTVEGWSDNYLRVRVPAPNLPINTIVLVQIESITEDGTLIGVIDPVMAHSFPVARCATLHGLRP
jgi:threonylcarbamoyladenosine tRNA methylthiotransferase MtaB